MIDPRITRQRFDAAGHLIESWDPRLWGTALKPNQTTLCGLSGQPLLTDSVDGGWQLSLLDQVGSPCSFWDARGSQRHTEFDEQQRPITVTEQAAGELPHVVERLTYGDSDPAFAEHNQCGQLIRHDDPAGVQTFPAYGLGGAVLVEERRFLADLETPDWPLDIEERETWLEAQSFITRHTFTPGGELREQTDAMGNVRTFGYNVAGKVSETWLHMADSGKPPQCLVSDIRYNAQNQVERETAGNGVLTRVEYAADDGRLIRLTAVVGNQTPLQDLNYVYDAAGNIVELHDRSQPVTHFNNQRIDPINRYRYDSLYQLVEARGWEVSQPSHGPTLPELLPTPLDPNQRRNYTQRFEYDRGGNLLTRQHSGAPGFSMFTSARSNRSLGQRDDGSLPGEPDIDSGFDAGGNQRELQRGQAMLWDSRNQLTRVTLVKRETGPDDYEGYRYDRPGHRLRKVGFAHSSGRTLRTEVRYLTGLEIHRQAEGEEHHVISIEAGRSNVRALHWPQGTHDEQLRYSLNDHLGSSTLELDEEAGVLTQEHYYPFGGTACWAGKSALVAQYKIYRYSGKERDTTGLYYYGYRYYAPWLQRWISPDPGGNIDGLNLYRMVGNRPTVLRDLVGLAPGLDDDDLWGELENFVGMDELAPEAKKPRLEIDPSFTTTGNELFDSYFNSGLQDQTRSYFFADLQQRLDAAGSDAIARVALVNRQMTHREEATGAGFTIYSVQGANRFINTYTREMWTFSENFKNDRSTNYFASDVAMVQYINASKSGGFFGYLPSVFKGSLVVNQQTLDAINGLANDPEMMLKVFISQTPLGKSISKVLKDFGLKATKISREDFGGTDVYISVEPMNAQHSTTSTGAVPNVFDHQHPLKVVPPSPTQVAMGGAGRRKSAWF
ncbi:RHS repeat-associated protein [Pseudomonas sp. S30_BP2TU TE3576]|uniref:RHS repeat domain-containing protein n=1 Tax=Pseudomonas sp. S30_BP2TU TE3576 TaxID=3349329 RepID=UPI003D1CB072